MACPDSGSCGARDKRSDESKFMASVSPGLFMRQVRQELAKVTWPSRRETTMSLILVFVFCTVIGLYFLVVDKILSWGVSKIFGV
jgi:preprotein translocase subunit SecE